MLTERRIVHSALVLVLAACGGDGGDVGGSPLGKANAATIGQLPVPLPVRDDVEARLFPVEIFYEPTVSYALVQLFDGTESGYLVDLESGAVRGACPLNPRVFTARIGDSEEQGFTTAFKVEGELLKSLHIGGLDTCTLGADATTLGTLTTTPFQGSALVNQLGEQDAIVGDSNFWPSPSGHYSFDGEITTIDWSGYSLNAYAATDEDDGFVVAATEQSSTDIVAFESDLAGQRTEIARAQTGGDSYAVEIVDHGMILRGPTCTEVAFEGFTVADMPNNCDGITSQSPRGTIVNNVWTSEDGSTTVDHSQPSTFVALTPWAAIHWLHDGATATVRSIPLDAEPSSLQSAPSFDVSVDTNNLSEDQIQLTSNLRFLDDGTCVLGTTSGSGLSELADNILVFQCDDLGTAELFRVDEALVRDHVPLVMLQNGVQVQHEGNRYTISAAGFVDESFVPTTVFDERMFAVSPRVRLSYDRALGVGFDGTLYRLSSPH